MTVNIKDIHAKKITQHNKKKIEDKKQEKTNKQIYIK